MFPSNTAPSAATATSLKLNEHYSKYLEQLKANNAKINQARINKQIELMKLKEKNENEKKQLKAMEEEKKVIKAEESKIDSIEKLFIGKGSASANKRIFCEYRSLTTSKEFKNFNIVMKDNNIYIWRMIFDILKFDISKELKQDFEVIQKFSGKVT